MFEYSASNIRACLVKPKPGSLDICSNPNRAIEGQIFEMPFTGENCENCDAKSETACQCGVRMMAHNAYRCEESLFRTLGGPHRQNTNITCYIDNLQSCALFRH